MFKSTKRNIEMDFNQKLDSIMSVFKDAHGRAVQLISDIRDDISEKELTIANLQENVSDLKKTESNTARFISNIEQFIS